MNRKMKYNSRGKYSLSADDNKWVMISGFLKGKLFTDAKLMDNMFFFVLGNYMKHIMSVDIRWTLFYDLCSAKLYD